MTTRTTYYVTGNRNDRSLGWLYGPMTSADLAEMMINIVRSTTIAFDPLYRDAQYSVSSITRTIDDTRPFPNGQFNHMVGR